MTIYYTVNAAFMHYLDSFKEQLEVTSLDVNQNWTMQATNPSNFPTINSF